MTGGAAYHPVGAALEEAYVLHGRALRDGTALEDTPRFGEEKWPLAPASLMAHQRGLTLNFDEVPPAYRHDLKKLVYAALSAELPAREQRPSIATVSGLFYNVAVFFRWLDTAHPGVAIPELGSATFEEYQRHLLLSPRTPMRRANLRRAVAYLWRYREALGTSALKLDPRTLPAWDERATRRTENSTLRIPEEVHTRLLVWATRFVDDFSPDIIAAYTQWQALRIRRHPRRRMARETDALIRSFIDETARSRRPLPAHNDAVNHMAIARMIGCDRLALHPHKDSLVTLGREVGVSNYAYLGIPIHGQLDGTAWIEGVTVEVGHPESLSRLTQTLQAACYILIAFLSGMRDSEIKHLRAGCLNVHLDANGSPYRWTVRSQAFKGEGDPMGTSAIWVIGEPAARAIRVLEQIQDSKGDDKQAWLFAAIRTGAGRGSAGRTGNPAMTSASTARQLQAFSKWVNDYCDPRRRRDTIPDVDGHPWRLSPSQFRRTLAWYIARRPGGSVAGAIAYRHHSIQMFEGYAGTSDSGFRAEVEAEQALARAENLLALIDREEHLTVSGPAATEARARLTALSKPQGFNGIVTTDRRRLMRILRRNDPQVYPSKYVTCVYDPRKALCHAAASSTPEKPGERDCKPLNCRNVALTSTNRQEWEQEIVRIDEQLRVRPKLPPALEARLRERQTMVRKLLDGPAEIEQ